MLVIYRDATTVAKLADEIRNILDQNKGEYVNHTVTADVFNGKTTYRAIIILRETSNE